MIAVHVFMGLGYYPQSSLGDYQKSFYGDTAIEDAEDYVDDVFPVSGDDWSAILVDRGEGLYEHSFNFKEQ